MPNCTTSSFNSTTIEAFNLFDSLSSIQALVAYAALEHQQLHPHQLQKKYTKNKTKANKKQNASKDSEYEFSVIEK
jgi:hypothetical protein